MVKTNEDFMNLLHKACKNRNVTEMDEYLNKRLYDIKPYDLTFKKKGGETDE